MINPTVGRVVLFTPAFFGGGWPANFAYYGTQPMAATVAYVWSDRLVNLAVVDHSGKPHSFTSVPLLQDDDQAPQHGSYAEWMPYQKGQAAKAEALEQKLTERA